MQKEMSFSFLTIFIQARLLTVDVQCHTAASLVAADRAGCVWFFLVCFFACLYPPAKAGLE